MNELKMNQCVASKLIQVKNIYVGCPPGNLSNSTKYLSSLTYRLLVLSRSIVPSHSWGGEQ